VVAGGGLLSAELASAMHGSGLETTLVIPGQWPLNHYVPKQHGLQILKRLRSAGIELVRQRRVASIGDSMVLDDGSELLADHYLPSIGQVPSLDFLDLDEDERRQGLTVDKYLRVQGVDGIYACGDIIRVSGYRDSFCHEENALLSGSVAGRNLAGAKEAYSPSMFLYSEFLDMRLESIGMGRADELKVAAFEWLDSESKGIALLSNQNRIQRISLINQSFRPESIGKLTEGLIAKPMREDASELMQTILRKYVQ
jgi:pyruvate/2-oxoglutarate dehydrogenase complex dihydrolipoamide dehydrogenase (E3) component